MTSGLLQARVVERETMPCPHSTSKTERIQGLVTLLFIEPFIFLFMKCID